jgi:hypothetical protein
MEFQDGKKYKTLMPFLPKNKLWIDGDRKTLGELEDLRALN